MALVRTTGAWDILGPLMATLEKRTGVVFRGSQSSGRSAHNMWLTGRSKKMSAPEIYVKNCQRYFNSISVLHPIQVIYWMRIAHGLWLIQSTHHSDWKQSMISSAICVRIQTCEPLLRATNGAELLMLSDLDGLYANISPKLCIEAACSFWCGYKKSPCKSSRRFIRCLLSPVQLILSGFKENCFRNWKPKSNWILYSHDFLFAKSRMMTPNSQISQENSWLLAPWRFRPREGGAVVKLLLGVSPLDPGGYGST